jgi:hypothetical protein
MPAARRLPPLAPMPPMVEQLGQLRRHDQRGAGARECLHGRKLLPHGYDVFTVDIQ